MFTLTTVVARRQFANLVNRVWFTKERAALTRYGRAIVAVVPIEDLERLERTRKGREVRKGEARKGKARARKAPSKS